MAIRTSDMNVDDRLLHVWLFADGGDGLSFQADVQRMLDAIATRHGGILEPADAPPFLSGPEGHSFASVRRPPPKLLDDAGIHRAQMIPHGSHIGRIFTSAVGVESLTHGIDLPP
jgi:hypothetical protein